MPGILSNIFDQGSTEGDGQSSSSDAESLGLGVDHVLDLDPEIGIHSATGGTYQSLDGSETTWSRTDDVTLGVDVHAATSVALDLTQLDANS